MRAIDKAVEHYQSIEVTPLEVEEWDETFYYKPMTCALKEKIFNHSEKNGKTQSLFPYAMIFMLLDGEGELVFNLGDLNKLMNNVDQAIIDRVGQTLFGKDDSKN